jgi:hypothetical protein
VAALPIAAQWVVPQYVDPMAGRSPEGLLVVLRRGDPTVVPPTVAHMAEQLSAAHTEGQPSLLVALTGPIMVPVPLQQVSRLARRPARRLPPIATTHLIVIRRHITLHHPGSVGRGAHAGPQTQSVVPFFAFREIGRAIGEHRLREVVFTRHYSWR